MQTIFTIEDIPTEYTEKGSVISIGNFDGVHRGHQALIQKVTELATTQGHKSAVISFTPHPLRVLLGDAAPPSLLTDTRKLAYLAAQHLDCAFLLCFTKELATEKPEEFVARVLVKAFNVKHLVVGYDYAFGKGRKGNIALLRNMGEKYNFSVTQLEPVQDGETIISSTSIRDALQQGNVAAAAALLGRYYSIEGTVIPGYQRGRKIGFPTANIQTDSFILRPKVGVYAVYAEVQGKLLPAVANIGTNPTFSNKILSVEAHILDFTADMYGENLVLHFVQHLRDQEKFSGIAELVLRIKKDTQQAREIFAASAV